MIDLNTLLQRAQAAVEAKEARKGAEAKLKVARSKPEREQALAEVQRLTAIEDWRVVALVLRSERWTCACGSTGIIPDGLYVFEKHARLANTTRMVRVSSTSEVADSTPRRKLIAERAIGHCPDCGNRNGFILPFHAAAEAPIVHSPRVKTAYLATGFVEEWKAARQLPKESYDDPSDSDN